MCRGPEESTREDGQRYRTDPSPPDLLSHISQGIGNLLRVQPVECAGQHRFDGGNEPSLNGGIRLPPRLPPRMLQPQRRADGGECLDRAGDPAQFRLKGWKIHARSFLIGQCDFPVALCTHNFWNSIFVRNPHCDVLIEPDQGSIWVDLTHWPISRGTAAFGVLLPMAARDTEGTHVMGLRGS